ncbi:hypothetical protein CYK57_01358 [Actinobacillus pleuropneumoniae]|uniref:Uncharacterized protein n=1 Tax=Actinobacillus pleuropneumoniae serovar 6 str. Femo TaxID=754256 RepID=A0A828PJC3_ACTPL|nr:hypothetical protein appser2_11840 [Actinobacillus pleuropneumoniae serovar 2 str. S1536]EFM89672.1 hypothetical protein appser4_12150 [Actinobacillus pleuropneumoniae serovar 4 str. M62]EFM91741.1 hypothetical protein appser6_13320 [Actinobacillus pleuropneumoniae serovar 6 str. Femo]EFM93924.1 hypothetical protein appser9_13090 [Actinobacillus pleuropneumoniae serovar 9 str. CVJ13261]EFM96188.1 hypothetical protein appser10_12330 [Actinobacillus pleuropneumoniae serovar 10 str. D13039]EFM
MVYIRDFDNSFILWNKFAENIHGKKIFRAKLRVKIAKQA